MSQPTGQTGGKPQPVQVVDLGGAEQPFYGLKITTPTASIEISTDLITNLTPSTAKEVPKQHRKLPLHHEFLQPVDLDPNRGKKKGQKEDSDEDFEDDE